MEKLAGSRIRRFNNGIRIRGGKKYIQEQYESDKKESEGNFLRNIDIILAAFEVAHNYQASGFTGVLWFFCHFFYLYLAESY